MGGRGAGKTRLGAEWVDALVRGLPRLQRGQAALRRSGAGRRDAGRRARGDDRGAVGHPQPGARRPPRFEATRRRLVWPNGAVAQVFSSEDPESLRGPQFDAAWCDELGCPAVDKGPNQPNVFPDPKVGRERAALVFERRALRPRAGGAFCRACRYWDPGGEISRRGSNPLSPVYGGRMVDWSRAFAWAWDARPYPAFPLRADRWADARQLALRPLAERPAGGADGRRPRRRHSRRSRAAGRQCRRLDGAVEGYVVDEPSSARARAGAADRPLRPCRAGTAGQAGIPRARVFGIGRRSRWRRWCRTARPP